MTSPLSYPQAEFDPPRFRSILFQEAPIAQEVTVTEEPDFFSDLNLDQLLDSIVQGSEEYDLKPFFNIQLRSIDAIAYRHEAFRDLENHGLLDCVQSFAAAMRSMRGHLAQAKKLHYKRQQDRWFLDAVNIYCDAVRKLAGDLTYSQLCSHAFVAFREYLISYTVSAAFTSLAADTTGLQSDLAKIRYSLHIEGKRVTVSSYDSEPDYGADVLQTFEKFRQGAIKRYRFNKRAYPEMNHVEAAILDLVAKLHSDVFTRLEEYCRRYGDYLDETIRIFDREVQFYIAFLQYTRRFRTKNLSFCYPEITARSKEIYAHGAFDLALANRVAQETSVVTNEFYLNDPERIIVVSGPNQGGKTTFARMFGQLHYLANLGCLVPGTEAKLFLYDRLLTHFEKEENIGTLTGKLEDDLLRIHRILESATPDSILIMNESFLSTTVEDALFLSKQIMERVVASDMLCVTVTFLDELASFSDSTVSMVSTVEPSDPALRTFKIVRKPADGLAHAVAIAEKYRLRYSDIKTRITERTKESVAS